MLESMMVVKPQYMNQGMNNSAFIPVGIPLNEQNIPKA